MPHRHAYFLLVFIVLGVIAAAVTGYYFVDFSNSVGWIGDLFLNSLRMLVLPLIVAAVISGVTNLGDPKKLGRVGGLTITYYFSTTIVAAIIGLFMVNLIEPGTSVTTFAKELDNLPDKKTGFADIILSLVNPNLVKAAAETDLLPIIFFCIIFGVALTRIDAKGKPVISFFDGLFEATMKIVNWLMYLAPIGIYALVSKQLGKAGGGEAFFEQLSALGYFVLTVLLGLALHFIFLWFVAIFIGRQPPRFALDLARPLAVAFGTASSSATLPQTMAASEEAGLRQSTIQFVQPLGSTVNMDGTAMYEAVAALFIAQAYGIELGFMQQTLVVMTAALAAIGAAGIPEAGLVTMIIVLNAVGLPLEGLGLLLAVDWFLDRFRTAVNVWGDAVGTAVVDRFR